jgi:protease I
MVQIAILVGEGFEESEFSVPYDKLSTAGHEITVLGSEAGKTICGKHGKTSVLIEKNVKDVSPDYFDALVIPGGFGPDRLRLDQHAVTFAREFVQSGKLVAAICHGPQLLIEAGIVKGRTLTSWPSVRTDLINAGANWVDKSLVEDGNLITSRKPGDLDEFCGAIMQHLKPGHKEVAM